MKTLDKELSVLLSDYQVLYQKLRGYHWTVTGPLFFELHAKFEELYGDAALKVDAVAERIAARGSRPPVTLKECLTLARLQEDGQGPAPLDMARNVCTDIEKLNGWLRELARKAEQENDTATFNLLDGFADGQEKTLWMMRAYLAQ